MYIYFDNSMYFAQNVIFKKFYELQFSQHLNIRRLITTTFMIDFR